MPFETAVYDLGNRQIEIIPIPGHEEASIAVYDHETKILLTGDSFYPGRLYISDWMAYKASIERLLDFTSRNEVVTILGNHIEMSNSPGKDYPMETIYQPQEQTLPLTVQDLKVLHKALTKLGREPRRKVLDKFIIYPN
jgi:glyoxylase-like metal-dependent hydrolase (beta-lactamase superfamily II)